MFKSKTTKDIAGNTIYQIVGKVISMSITVLTTVIVTRAYGRLGYGEFSIMQNWPALFFVIVDFGINAIAVRELTKDFSNAGRYLGNILILRVLFSLVIIALLSVALVFFPYSTYLKIGIFFSLFLILTQALYTTTNIIFQVKLKYDLSTIGYISGYILIFVTILLLSFLKSDLRIVSFMYVLGGIVTYIMNYLFIKKLGVAISFALDRHLIKYLLLESLPLGLMFVFSQINFKADSILLSVMELPKAYGLNNTESVAVYSLPYKIFEVALVVPTFFMNSVYPVLVKHMSEGKDRLRETFMRSLVFLALAAVLASVVGVILSPWVIQILGGSQFVQSVLVLQILVGGLLVYYLTQPISWLIVTLGKQNYLPYIYLVSAVFNVAANAYFIPRYSFYASAVITHLSEVSILILLVFFAHRSWKNYYA